MARESATTNLQMDGAKLVLGPDIDIRFRPYLPGTTSIKYRIHQKWLFTSNADPHRFAARITLHKGIINPLYTAYGQPVIEKEFVIEMRLVEGNGARSKGIEILGCVTHRPWLPDAVRTAAASGDDHFTKGHLFEKSVSDIVFLEMSETPTSLDPIRVIRDLDRTSGTKQLTAPGTKQLVRKEIVQRALLRFIPKAMTKAVIRLWTWLTSFNAKDSTTDSS